MLSKELVKKIRHIEIKSNRLVDQVFSGEYRSNFRGKGMEFEDIRQYYIGDDVRNIDWNVTARHNQAYVKQFGEERELNIYLMIDISKSRDYGRKKDLIAEIGATISFSANRNNDRVGMILFSDQVEKFIPSEKGRKHTLSIIDTLLTYEPKSQGTNIKEALEYYVRMMKRKSILFVISDFMDEDFEKAVLHTGSKHDVILIRILDPIEEKIPSGAIFTFQDLETGEMMTVDHRKKGKGATLPPLNLPNTITIYTDEDYVKKLRSFFMKRGVR